VKRPAAIKKGDQIGLFAPARKIQKDEILGAIKIIENQGYVVGYTDELFADYHQFAGNDDLRANYFQKMLDDEEVSALISVRGGYGSVRIIDKIDFSRFTDNPKWIIGYSDITVFHSHLNKNYGVETLHATMPLNFKDNSQKALSGLFDILEGGSPDYVIDPNPLNRPGECKSILTGGNLSVLYSLLGSKSFPKTEGKILFIEDLDEYLYHIDRMMMAFKRARIFNGLKGLIVGGMTEMNDNEVPFGQTAEEIILDVISDFNFPVCFGFPAGHFNNNLPLIMGAEVSLNVSEEVFINF